MPILHPFFNPKPDGADGTIARPSDWNASHAIGNPMTNANASTMPPGTPAYCSASGQINLAKGDNAATAECVGLLPAALLTNQLGIVQDVDSITLATTGLWDAITGDSGGLTPGTRYYVSQTTAGKLVKGTAIASTAGLFGTSVGIALTPLTMQLKIQPPIGY